MTLSMNELACIFFALNQDKEGKPRRFQFTELAKVSEIAKALDSCVKDGKIEDKEHTVKLTPEQKVFIKEKVEEINWQMGDAKIVMGLTEKLNA